MSEKIYCGSGKLGNYGLRISIDLNKITEDHVTEKNGSRYVNLDVNERRNGADKYGNTHSVSVNTWKPNKAQEQRQEPQQEATGTDDLPF